MKKCFIILFVLIQFGSLVAQNIPIDFQEDGEGADWVWTTFENDINPPLEIIDNPDPSGINISSQVAKFTALEAGQAFAGCESLHGAGIGSFTIDEDNAIIRIMVWKSVISDVGIKLVRSDNWSLGEIKISNTLINEWEQIEFDFSDHIGNTYDQMVIFPDFANRASDNIIYFDNIYGELAMTSSIPKLNIPSATFYPNPGFDKLIISPNQNLSSYKIYSSNGTLLLEKESFDAIDKIDISNLPSGAYFLKTRKEEQQFIERFIKM